MQAARCAVAVQTRSGLLRSLVLPQSFQEAAIKRITGQLVHPAPGGKSGFFLTLFSLSTISVPFFLCMESSLSTVGEQRHVGNKYRRS